MVAKAVAAASLLLGAMARTGLAASSAAKAAVEIPAAGGTRPIAAFGVATGQHQANQQVALTADADIGPSGLYVKGYVLNAEQYKQFDAACTKGQTVAVYEWGFGSCDDYLTALKALGTDQTSFTATATATEAGGAKIAASVQLKVANQGAGIYLVFENLLGAPVTFKNAQLTVAGAAAGAADKDLAFPAATVHMSAAVVKVASGLPVDAAAVKFTAKNANPPGAKSTAVMVLNKDQLEADKLGCTMGFYFGWFKSNKVGLNVCKGIDFELHEDGDLVTIRGIVKYVPGDKQAEMLAGDIQVDPQMTYFQGDGAYSFAASANGAQGVAVVIPNRLDTPITLEDLHVEYSSAFAGLVGGPLAGLCIGLIALVAFLMLGSFFFGKRRGAAATGPAAGPKGAGMV